MLNVEMYAKQHEDMSYSQLLKLRDELIEEIRAYENHTDLNTYDYDIEVSPDEIYQMNLQYLGEVCRLMARKVLESTSSLHIIRPEEYR